MSNSAFTQGILQTPLVVALGGTGLSSLGSATQVIRVNAGGTALEYATIGTLSDGDKGDITVSSSGTVWTIDNSAVTFSKIANIATSRILGRTTASSGVIEELTVGTGLSLGSGSLSLDATLVGLSSLDTTSGVLVQTATDTFTKRTLTGTTNQITVTNGDGVAGNPTFSLPATIVTTSVQPTSAVLAGSSSTTNTSASSAQILGSTNTQYQLSTGGITVTPTADYSMVGTLLRQSTITEASSGTHILIANLGVKAPIINNGSGSTTNASTVYIEGAPTGTATPTNVYALWVDDGVVRIDGTIELGAASDTTLSRSAAGVLAVEGVAVPTISSTSTLTNKRIDPRVVSAASYTTSTTIDSDATDVYVITAQAGALLFNNPSGTPVQGQKLIIRIKDNGTARVLTYGSQFRAMGTALPATTVLSKTMYMGFMYNSTDTKWDLLSVAQEA